MNKTLPCHCVRIHNSVSQEWSFRCTSHCMTCYSLKHYQSSQQLSLLLHLPKLQVDFPWAWVQRLVPLVVAVRKSSLVHLGWLAAIFYTVTGCTRTSEIDLTVDSPRMTSSCERSNGLSDMSDNPVGALTRARHCRWIHCEFDSTDEVLVVSSRSVVHASRHCPILSGGSNIFTLVKGKANFYMYGLRS